MQNNFRRDFWGLNVEDFDISGLRFDASKGKLAGQYASTRRNGGLPLQIMAMD
jgi:hypothetical protein